MSCSQTHAVNVSFFIGSYLLVWARTGIVLLLTQSIPANYFFIHFQISQLQVIYGIVLLVSDMNDNGNSKNVNTHMAGINMDMSKNTNAKSPYNHQQ